MDMTDEKYKKYIVNEDFGVEDYDNLYDIFEYWKQNPATKKVELEMAKLKSF